MATGKGTPPTHPSVFVGLGLAAVGLLVALYAYTGERIYDITFAFVALAGGALALAGILVSAWGRSVMASRAQRARRGGPASVATPGVEPPPTVASRPTKRGFSLSFAKEKEAKKAPGAMFAFKRGGQGPPATPAPDAPAIAPTPGGKAGLFAFRKPPAPPPPTEPVVERFTLRCPQCAQQFTAEGVRPLTVACPNCGKTGDL